MTNRIFRKAQKILKSSRNDTLVTHSDLDKVREFLDADWYSNTYTDVDFATIEPAEHYLLIGYKEQRAPHPLFDIDWYSQQEPEYQSVFSNPLLHFLNNANKSTSAHPLFDGVWYLEQYADVRTSGMNAMHHYIRHGAMEGRSPHPLFDVRYYKERNAAQIFEDPLLHYVSGKGTSPHPLFDEDYYREQIQALDCDNTPMLQHFVLRGAVSGYNPNRFFDCLWYIESHENLHETGENPLVHFLRIGLREGRDPHPMFDVDWYLFANPDVARSGMNPLHHYLGAGEHEGRRCRPVDVAEENCAVLDVPYEVLRSPVGIAGRDVCIFVTFSKDGAIAPHVQLYLESLQSNDIAVILTIVTEGLAQRLPDFTDRADGIVVRINHGWDFAAWATVMAAIPEVWVARSLILTNDSIFGPTDSDNFRKMLIRVRDSAADFVALTDSYQVKPHLMSYFSVLKTNALKSEVIRSFWNNVRSMRNKNEVIYRYELESLSVLAEAGLSHEILFPTQRRFDRARNPTLEDWRKLLGRGFPFIKVQALRDRLIHSDTSGWQGVLTSNPPLVAAINKYLEAAALRSNNLQVSQSKSRFLTTGSPVPRPRMRFKRSKGLKTFYGAVQSTRPTKGTDLCFEVPFRTPVNSDELPNRVAVLAHIFYPEMCAEIRSMLGNIPIQADLFISTDTSHKKQQIERSFAGFRGDVTVEVFPNIGRDIAPMLVGFPTVFDRYEFFLHIHSKRSPHSPRFATWRTYLFENLLGSQDIVASILSLLKHTNVGIVFSDHFEPVRSLLNWGGNYDRARALLQRVGIEISKDIVLDFPSSSFFWGRCEALRPLLDVGLKWSDFDPEAGQIDGTLAHAIERSIAYLAEARGFTWVKVGVAGNVAPCRLVPSWIPEDVSGATRHLLGNRLPPLENRNLIPELVSVISKPDRQSTRPRFNIIIPTLAPEQVFGGISTALRIFEEISAALGPEYDSRIICQSQAVDMRAMLAFTEYRLIQSGNKDDYPKVVVDITDQESGELGIRRNDIFLATAWWTATTAFEMKKRQSSYFGRSNRIIYLIQDHEPDFYGWSAQYGLAQHTYSHTEDMIALINSEELASYMVDKYSIFDSYVVRFTLNPKIGDSLKPLPRERIICIYGRPGTPRNAFPLLCAGLGRWQQNSPEVASAWQIIAAGEAFNPDLAGPVNNLSVVGKLSLDAYGELLSTASVGISLMLSPHPSYPPLEMAAAGIITITNAFVAKDLSLRSQNVISIPHITADAIAAALEEAVNRAEKRVGTIVKGDETSNLPCTIFNYDPATIAVRIKDMS